MMLHPLRSALLLLGLLMSSGLDSQAQHTKRLIDEVNPFIGTTNFGTTNPGARMPQGLMSVTPFNVMGSDLNVYDKDARWFSTPYEYHNQFFTGLAHVNLSGVGCPDMGSLLLMATTGELEVDYRTYGSTYTGERAHPGYYAVELSKYRISAESTATMRTGISRFRFPAGASHILLNLGEGLTNESGATVRRVSATEIEGSKLLGNFCYQPQAVYPIYFVLQVSKAPTATGYWKKQRPMTGAEAEWDRDQGKYKLYTKYHKELSGDDIGAYFTFDTSEGEEIEVRVGISFVSIDNARANLQAETDGRSFAELRREAEDRWEQMLSRIQVEGGTPDQRTVFYTALYHTLIHPSVLQDVNGQYPMMESDQIGHTDRQRYTIFSLWDTYRNVHQLLTLVYPEIQRDMLHSMLDMYRESGWLPKWELFGRESLTMEGDPAIPVIVDSWMKGLRDFDVDLAYEAMYKSATTLGDSNLLRPDNDDYMRLGYVPLRGTHDNSVSHALEYYVADHALSTFAAALGKKADARLFGQRSQQYHHYYSRESGTMRPKLPNGQFLSPFDPKQGMNFEPVPGFHEGSAWNYTFFVPHDIPGLTRLMGGKGAFVRKLQSVFDNDLFDPTNEPNIAYPYLFSYFRGEEWRTEKLTREILAKHFRNSPDGLPGNDDTGTMSSWAIFSMMGLYPDVPGVPEYTLTAPTFERITIQLDRSIHGRDQLVITTTPHSADQYIRTIEMGDGRQLRGRRITHQQLMQHGHLHFVY